MGIKSFSKKIGIKLKCNYIKKNIQDFMIVKIHDAKFRGFWKLKLCSPEEPGYNKCRVLVNLKHIKAASPTWTFLHFKNVKTDDVMFVDSCAKITC